ncbi:hypothetical protein DVS77_12630 [Mycolicibacterium moriokaense]|nr:hypothetical protein DVS77_12630 [Mycolicibacterium moriokaense]
MNHLIPSLGRPPHACPEPIYRLTDRLHDGRTARVAVDEIATTLAGWLAELDASSPIVDDLVTAVRQGDWPTTYIIAERLSIEVAVAA